jgi:redox-sensitive bicupin YhaK (pirin superfamily)
LGIAGVAAGHTALKAEDKAGKSTYDKLMEQVGFNHIPADGGVINKNENMKTVLHKAATRGHASHGWLDSHHTFSFANYYNPERTNFGVLRVLNDDVVSAGRGFGRHPHDNMEIISIPLEGNLEHQDSMGNKAVIKQGDVQVMSAGTGVFHSEKNESTENSVRFLQIWMFPNQRNVTPRYDQITLKTTDLKNEFYQILSPNQDDEGVSVHQNAWFHLGNFESGQSTTYHIKDAKNGVYAFILEGEVTIEGQTLGKRDGFGVWDATAIKVEATADAKILLMDVPMTV